MKVEYYENGKLADAVEYKSVAVKNVPDSALVAGIGRHLAGFGRPGPDLLARVGDSPEQVRPVAAALVNELAVRAKKGLVLSKPAKLRAITCWTSGWKKPGRCSGPPIRPLRKSAFSAVFAT